MMVRPTPRDYVPFLTRNFRAINEVADATSDRQEGLRVFLAATKEFSDSLIAMAMDGKCADAQLTKTLLSVFASALEHHGQRAKLAPGEALSLVPGLALAMITIAQPLGCSPFLTASDLWQAQLPGGEWVRFTNSESERNFGNSVRTHVWVRRTINEDLRAIIRGDIDAGESRWVLEGTTRLFEAAHDAYMEFDKPDCGVTGRGFLFMRDYLPPTRIYGIDYASANAAALLPMMVTEPLLGTADTEHRTSYFDSLRQYLTPTERVLLDTDLSSSTVLDMLGRTLGLTDQAGLESAGSEMVSAAVLAAPRPVQETVSAATRAQAAYVRESGAHLRQIHRKLIQAVNELSSAELESLAVNPGAGVGGNSHAHTTEIHRRRQHHPGWRLLKDAVRALSGKVEG